MKHLGILIVLCSLLAGCAVSTAPLVQEDILKRIATDREAMYKDQEPLGSAITLEEAMARSIKYNLDHRLKIMEDALALRQVDLMKYDMLPKLVAAAGYTERDSYNASSSMNVATNTQSLAPSTSSDLGHYNGDLTLTWNILDFGVSYFQAKQQADRAHIMTERRRKVVHSIMQQVRQAYWLALGAQQLEGRFEPLLKGVAKALQDSSSIEQEKLRAPLEALTYRKTLLEIMKQLETFRDELAQAKPRLASLMNVPLGQSFTLSPSKMEMVELSGKIGEMESKALLQRPELLEADYNERISVEETRKAIARMLPGVELSVGGHSDSNSFLVNQQWIEGGARLTWNLMNLISGPSQYKIATSQVEIAQMQRLSLSMAVLTQVHVAYRDFYNRKRQYELSEQLQDIDARIHEQTMNQAKSGAQNQLNEIRSETSSLMAEYRSYQNYASLQSACGQMLATLGEDPLPATAVSHNIKPLAVDIGVWLHGPGALCLAVPAAPVVAAPPAPAVKLPVVAVAVPPVPVVKPPVAAVAVTPVPVVAPPAPVIKPPVAAVVVTPVPAVAVQPAVVATLPKASSGLPASPLILPLAFGRSESEVRPYHHDALKTFADYFKECPDATVEISGHTDNIRFVDNSDSNRKLSQRRADNIRNYLITTYGIEPGRITARGFGSLKPIAGNGTKEGRRKNRRIEANFTCEKK